MTQNSKNNLTTDATDVYVDDVYMADFDSGMQPPLQAWIGALQHASATLPQSLRFDDMVQRLDDKKSVKTNQISLALIEQLEALPVFALSVVVQTQALLGKEQDGAATLHHHVEAWAANNPHWQVIAVDTPTITINSQANKDSLQNENHSSLLRTADDASETDDYLTPVYCYRYVLLPTDNELMSPSKKEAAAHMLDDALTSHLRQFIDTMPITPTMGGDAAIDCHIVPLAKILRPHKIACFDMDSTLIEQEVIVELAKHAGIGDKVSAITESAMRGEIDFNTSFSQRVALLEGLPAAVLDDIQSQLTISTGARALLRKLKQLGYHTVLLSGGFTYFAERIATELGIDEVHANSLDLKDNIISGEISLPIVDGERKAALVAQIAKRRNVPLSQVICVGDGANDLAMMARADLGIAYHAKPIVRARADAAINATGLEGVLYILGYAANDWG